MEKELSDLVSEVLDASPGSCTCLLCDLELSLFSGPLFCICEMGVMVISGLPLIAFLSFLTCRHSLLLHFCLYSKVTFSGKPFLATLTKISQHTHPILLFRTVCFFSSLALNVIDHIITFNHLLVY